MRSLDLPSSTSLETIASRSGVDWPAIRGARAKAEEERTKIGQLVTPFLNEDLSFVVFGSIARGESTTGSDLDWALLIDGQTSPAHLDSVLEIRSRIEREGFKQPGPEGVFGDLMFSHDLVHYIGGEDDDNANTTRRLLLLLESTPIGRRDAYDRTVLAVLNRYVLEDAGLQRASGKKRVPRFLQNDIARYWRTMAVDFAYKRRTRGGQGWALRTAKLRLSRKLIYASGLTMCFSCALEASIEQGGTPSQATPPQRIVEYLSGYVGVPPLDIMAHFLLRFPKLNDSATTLFTSYDRFLALLNDEAKRQHLAGMTSPPVADDEIYREVRDVSTSFQRALTEIFMEREPDLTELTKLYGVF